MLIRITLDDPRDYILYREGSGPTVEVQDIQVMSERRKGKGRQLIDKVLKRIEGDCRLLYAITRADNFIAQEFYEALNFRVVGNLRNFYGTKNEDGNHSVDAVMYGRDL